MGAGSGKSTLLELLARREKSGTIGGKIMAHCGQVGSGGDNGSSSSSSSSSNSSSKSRGSSSPLCIVLVTLL